MYKNLNLGEAQKLAAEKDADAVKALYAERGLHMGGWGLPVNWRGTDQQFYEGLSRLPAAAQLAAQLGCHRVMTVVLGWSDEMPRREHFNFTVKRLSRC